MSWDDAEALASRLKRSLDAFNWTEAAEICSGIINRTSTDPELLPESLAKKLLSDLRRKRRFDLVTQVSEAIFQSGLRTPLIRRHYAQALIDRGVLAAAEMILQTIIQDPMGDEKEEMEARGLIGRIYKQIYINNQNHNSQRNRANLERALADYAYVYRLDPKKNLWHGINAVALSERARRDGLPLAGLPNASTLAHEILATLAAKKAMDAWDLATAMEAYVALGRNWEATDAALKYVDRLEADAFELNSTIRQLTELWQLTDQEPPGSDLLPILKAGYLRRDGATAESDFKEVVAEAVAASEATKGFEGEFGPDRTIDLKWYQQALAQCRSIARVESLDGEACGMGWLVKASDFFPDRAGVLLLTNEHVISDDLEQPLGILTEDAQANFQILGQKFKVKEMVWSSSYLDLDATLVSLEGEPETEPLRLHKRPMEIANSSHDLCIIGLVGGDGLPSTSGSSNPKWSLQNTYLLAQNESVFHYRTPAEGISSGSPVFESKDWRVVALHHQSAEVMPRIDGRQGTYEASEGISIQAIQQAIKAQVAVDGLESDPLLSGRKRAIRGGVSVDDLPVDDSNSSAATFYAAIKGEGAHGSSALFSTNVDLVFDYAPPPPDLATLLSGSSVDRTRRLQVPIGITVMPVGFKFTDPDEPGYRQIRFYTSAATRISFKLRAMDVPDTTEDTEIAPPQPGFYVIFDLRGAIVSQSFLPAKLVRTLAELKEDPAIPTPFSFNLDHLKQFDDHTIKAQERLAVALQSELL